MKNEVKKVINEILESKEGSNIKSIIFFGLTKDKILYRQHNATNYEIISALTTTFSQLLITLLANEAINIDLRIAGANLGKSLMDFQTQCNVIHAENLKKKKGANVKFKKERKK